MANGLSVFTHEIFGTVRTVLIGDKIHFVGKDIASMLGYKNTNDAINKHCRWVAKYDVPHPQSENKTVEISVIPEGDLYRLIANSTLPKAEQFEKWIFDEVLPQIRQTGGYIPIQEEDDDASFMAKALLIANKTLTKKDQIIAQKDAHIAIVETEKVEVEKKLAITTTELNYKNDTIKDITEVVPAKTMRKMINEIIRHTVKNDYGSRWSHLYSEFLYRYSVNIPTRAENRGLANLDYVEQDGLLEKLYYLCVEMYEAAYDAVKHKHLALVSR